MLERKIEKVNYLKSIKEKEHKILNYYKKIHNKDSVKDKPIIKKRKRTKKNLGKDRLGVKKDETEDNDENSDNEPISIVAKQEKEKLTKKKQFVIMD
jgi:hypothetical protein